MMLSEGPVEPTSIERVCALLERSTSIAALPALANAIRFELPTTPLSETVIAFDANVLLRLSNNPRCEDIVDYLLSRFEGRLILPGQVIQEFWNNQFQAVASVSASVRKKFGELKEIIETFDDRYLEYAGRFEGMLDEFNTSFGYVFDENTVRKTRLVVNLLQEKAMVPFMPRALLGPTANARKRSRTPPGFKDELDGDFYVWADLLLGLAEMKKEGVVIGRVTLVTLDKKIDWSREGVPHPILSAEVRAICDADFETITVEALARKLAEA